MDMDQRTRMIGRGNAGRVILLGDGTEVNADHDDDVEMEDRGEAEELEDKDLAEQVQKGQADAKADTNGTQKDRGDREQTPGPNAPKETVEEKEVKSPMSPTVPTKLDPASTQPPEMKVPIEGVDNKKVEEEKSASEASK
ncbi:Protein phosphatase 2C 2 [Elasticomyces elasticus]|nr:Protein phosphatase 2C 2 [Elasticomyces elasticus]